ncbi:DUF3786 domain-containing protein [Desulfarculales bacterium]
MARVDDYQMSFDLSAAELAQRNFSQVAANAGAELAEDGSHLLLNYYGRPVAVDRDPIQVRVLDSGPALPLAEQALLLHYLERADGAPARGEWVTFREVESGEFYWSAFVKRAKAPLVNFFGEQPELLAELGAKVGGRPSQDVGDISLIVRALPRVKFMLVLWVGDEEFPPEGNVLMDKNIGHYLSTEDIALAAGLPIYKMMASFRH